MVYETISPFLWEADGGSQVMMTEREEVGRAKRFSGEPLGARVSIHSRYYHMFTGHSYK